MDTEELYSASKKFQAKKLVKTATKKSAKKKNKLFDELSFVEPHVDTFYIGLNDSPARAALNPVQAKVINVDEATDWVRKANTKTLRCFKIIQT